MLLTNAADILRIGTGIKEKTFLSNRTFVKNQLGFTIIELLVVCTIIGVLCTISISIYHEYKIRGYDSSVDYAIHHAMNALEVGKSNSDLGPNGYWTFSDANGSFQGDRNIIPGLTTTPETRVTVFYNGWCDSNAAMWCGNFPCCISDWVEARHCKGSIVKTYSRFNDGTVFSSEFPNWGGC